MGLPLTEVLCQNFPKKFRSWASKTVVPRAARSTWTQKRPVGLYQANLCSVVRAHGTLLGPPGVLVPRTKPFCKISEKSVSRARAARCLTSQISQRDKNWSQVRFYSCVSINTTGITQHKPPNNLFNHQNWPKTLKFSDFWGAAAKFEGGRL